MSDMGSKTPRNTRRDASHQRLLERRSQQVIIEVAQEIAAAASLDELFQRVVVLVKERFGYYHVQLLRYDPQIDAVALIAGYGEAGAKMLAAGHHMPMGVGLIGAAARTGETLLRTALKDDPDWRPNPLLPDTQGEIAVPIKWRSEVLGVLDVQSDEENALGEDDNLLLESLCGQIAIAIQNVRLVSDLRASQSQNETVLQDLSRERSLLRTLIDNLPDQVFVKDSQCRFLLNNNAHLRLMGLKSQEDALGKTDMDIFPGEDAQVYYQDELALMASGRAMIDHEEEVVNKDTGARGWNATSKVPLRDEHGNVIGLVGIARNVTERHLSDERIEEIVKIRTDELAASQARLSLLAANLPGIVFILDKEGVFQILEGRGLAELGLQEGLLVGLSAYDVYKDVPLTNEDVQRCLDNGEELATTIDFGGIFEFETRYVPLLDAGGQVNGLLGISTNVTERNRLEREVRATHERRGAQVKISTQIIQEIASAPDLHTIFERVVSLVKDQFGYYHTQILRYDPTRNAMVLVAGYGEAGQKMLESGHTIPLGVGLIGLASSTGQTVVRPAVVNAPEWKPNPLLLETRGEIAVPIKLRDQVLGILDVQSATENTLGEDDRLLLEGLCGQIAIAIEDTRLRQEMGERLHELDVLNRSASRQGWQAYRQTPDQSLDYFFDQIEVQPGRDRWLKETQLAMDCKQVLAPEQDGQAVAMPLTLRGEVIGALALEADPKNPISTQDLALIEAINEQVALALESARLFEQTQTALGETQTLYDIIAQMNAADSYADILAAMSAPTGLEEANPLLLMAVFDRPLGGAQRPEWIFPVAHRSQSGLEVADRYPLNAFEAVPNTLFTGQPVALGNLSSDHRLDRVTRTLFQDVFHAQSSIIIPLMLGGQAIGFVQGYFDQPTEFPASELERQMAVAGQAAIAVQSRLLLEQAQSRARQEQRIREVTSQVFSASDVDTIMRRAVEQIGHVLGLPAYIYLGQAAGEQTGQAEPTQA